MILDNTQKLAFVHIPHCGGSTLKKNLLVNDRFSLHTPIEVPGEYTMELILPENISALISPIDHLPCMFAPEGYDTVTVIKNPYHREVSAYNMYRKWQMFNNKTYFKSFEDYLKFKYYSDATAKFFQFTIEGMRKDCYSYIYKEDNPLSKFILKLENIEVIWALFAELYDLPRDVWHDNVNRNTPEYLDYRKMYTSELVDIVADNANRDCIHFGYSFE